MASEKVYHILWTDDGVIGIPACYNVPSEDESELAALELFFFLYSKVTAEIFDTVLKICAEQRGRQFDRSDVSKLMERRDELRKKIGQPLVDIDYEGKDN